MDNIKSLSCLIVSDFTLDPLVVMLEGDEDPFSIEAYLAPYDQVNQVLLDPDHSVWQQHPDVLLVWTRPEIALPAFGKLIRYERVPEDVLLAQVHSFAALITAVAERIGIVLIPSWTQVPYSRGVGVLNMRRHIGVSQALMRINLCLSDTLAKHENIFVLDASRWLAMTGERACHPKLWFMGKLLFSNELLAHAAEDIKAALHATVSSPRKLIVTDLDNTLWGGIVGDIGWQNLQLGGHSHLGEAFCTFQQELKAITKRGILLAIASKNEEAIALEAIDRHPAMVLHRDDFVTWRINWQDKALNIAEIAAELNLGLKSVVFLDDSPAERARVQEALPNVLVPELPGDKTLYTRTLLQLRCFDTIALTAEDTKRTAMYHSERKRQIAMAEVGSVQEWLATLGLIVRIEPLNADTLKRATQLLNKTNQMNLTTRRLSEHEFKTWAHRNENNVLVFSVCDRFGDYGLTGIASLSTTQENGRITDFVLSCRVFGRGVEQTMLSALIALARLKGIERVTATFCPTERNQPTLQFLDEHSGLRRESSDVYSWDTEHGYPLPDYIVCQGYPSSHPNSDTACHCEAASSGA